MLHLGTFAKVFFISGLLALTACQSSNVIVDYDTDASFAGYRYYQLQPQSADSEDFDPLMDERAQAALGKTLPKAGLIVETADHAADVIIRYSVKAHTQEKKPKSGASVGMTGGSSGNSAVGLSLSFPLGGNKVVKQLQLITDVVSPSDQALKWRASKIVTLSDEAPNEITAIIDAAFQEMLSFYPPGSKPE